MKYIKSVEFLENNVCRVTLDDFTVTEFDSLLASASSLAPDTEIEDELWEQYVFEADCLKAEKLATKLINTKMRTEKQLVKLLKEKKVSENVAVATAEKMKDYGYIDDAVYSRTYIEYRLENSKKSFKAIAFDLKLEGVSGDIIKEAIAEFDDGTFARAERVAEKTLCGRTDEQSIKKLSGVLQRNGFSWDEINHVIKKYGKSNREYDE